MSYLSTTNRRRFALAALATVTAAGAVSAPAHAAGRTHCDFDPTTGISMVQPAPDANGVVTELFLDQGRVMFRDAVGNDFCYGPHGEIAGSTNATSILFVGTPGKDDFIISQQGGRFGGGAPGGSDPTQIETTVLSDSQDILDITGTEQADSIGIVGGNGTGTQGGVLTFFGGSGKPTVKVTTPPSVVRVNGLNGTDNISGRGMFGPPTSMHLELAGGFGNDYLEGGLLAGDRLQGDDGNDSFFTRDGQPGDIVTGGVGVDRATVDVSDQATGVEQFNQAIGTLKLAQKTVTVDRGAATVKLSWTHPTGWKRRTTSPERSRPSPGPAAWSRRRRTDLPRRERGREWLLHLDAPAREPEHGDQEIDRHHRGHHVEDGLHRVGETELDGMLDRRGDARTGGT